MEHPNQPGIQDPRSGHTPLPIGVPAASKNLDPVADFLQSVEIEELVSADDSRHLEAECVREERWEDLAALLLERSSQVLDAAESSRCLMRAAQVYETNLGDTDSAFVVMLVAFQESPATLDLATDLARMATVHNRWPDLLAECEKRLPEIASAAKRADMLVAMAGWYQKDLGDAAAAEKALEAAMAANPSNPQAFRALVELHGQRGNWLRAAAYLTCASGSAADPADAIELALEAAEVFRERLHDMDAAIEQYTRILERSPGHPRATAALAELAWVRKDWPIALPLFENMAGSAKHALNESAQLWHKVAWSAQMLGDMERARAGYRRSHAALSTYLPTLQSWSQLARSQGWWQDVCQTIPRLLAQSSDRLSAAERADHLVALGKAHLELRDAESAAEVFMKALELAPDLAVARQALAEANARIEGRGSENAAALIEQIRRLLAGNLSSDERFEYLCRIGRLQREELHDNRAALETFLHASTLRPDDPDVLHELVELHTHDGHWSRVVGALERLVRVSSGKDKARTLVATANILNYELESPLEAVDLYNQALDEDPDDRRSFERIQRILSARQDWRALARAYRRMIRRLGANPSPDKRPWLLGLWRGLADLCWRTLRDIPAAAAAYEVCVSLAPEDGQHREALAKSYEAQGPAMFRQAVKTREHLLRMSSNADQAAKHIRALANLYRGQRRHDRVFCACGGLSVLMKADVRERGYYEKNALPSVPVASSMLTEAQWQSCISCEREDRRISQVLAAVSAGVLMTRVQDAASYGLEPRHRRDPTDQRSLLGRILVYISRFTGVPLPTIYAPPGAPGEIDLVVLQGGHRPALAFVLGRDLAVGRTDRELAFFLAKRLVGLRADRCLLWPRLVSTKGELRAILGAAIRLVRPRYELPEADPKAIRQYLAYLQRVLPTTQLAPIASAVESLLAGAGRIDLDGWLAAGEETANRAGLLACGDVMAAAREIVKEARLRRSRPEDAILAMVRWGVSSDYLDLRTQLGLALVSEEDKTPLVTRTYPAT
ncbi:MAG: tetratricopeptide repeat protein [Polyangia bacterium]